jgi:hypothetical protein
MLTKLPSPEAGSLEWLASEGDAGKRHLRAREATAKLGALANGSALVGGRGQSPSARASSPSYVRLFGEIADQTILDHLAACYPQAQIGHACASTEAGVGFEVDDGREIFPADLIEQPSGGVTRSMPRCVSDPTASPTDISAPTRHSQTMMASSIR